MDKTVLNINKKIASVTKVIDVSGDIIVPDIKPDIVSIVNSSAIPYIYKEEISTGRIRVEGNVDTYIVYLADNGENRSIQTTLTFLENIDDNGIKDGAYSKQRIYLENIETKLLNERKLSIVATVKIVSDIFISREIEVGNNNEDIENVYKLEENLEIKSLVRRNVIKTSVKENIETDPSYNIAEILKVSVNVQNMENKISINKVLAKADCAVKIIFLAEDGRIGNVSANLPIMSFIDANNVKENNSCIVEYYIRNMLFKTNGAEKHSINVQIDFEVNLEAYETKTLKVIQDMYGTKNKIEYSKKDIEVEINKYNNSQKISINEKILVEDVLNIYDVDTSFKVLNIKQVGTNYNYECELNLKFYYEADSRNGLNIKNVSIPFIVKLDNDLNEIEFNVLEKEFTVNGENVECRLEILAFEKNTNMKNISIIEDVKLTDLIEEDSYNMYIYFVKQGDTAWSISKKFRISVDELLKQNEIDNKENIKAGDRLYIMR